MNRAAAYLLLGLAVISAAAPAVAQEKKIVLPADHEYARPRPTPTQFFATANRTATGLGQMGMRPALTEIGPTPPTNPSGAAPRSQS